MKSIFSLTVLLFSFFASSMSSAARENDANPSLANDIIQSFLIAIGEYYRVPQQEVIVIRERRIPDDEIPVVLFIANRARVAPAAVSDYRLRGHSWTDTTLHFGLSPEIFYVPVRRVSGPPYGHAYGHYKNKHKSKWKEARLNDDDVVNLVNLRFISERYGYVPEEVIRLRSSGKNFVVINDEFRKGKRDKGEEKWEKKERKEARKHEKEERKEHKKGGKNKHDD